MGLDMYLNKKTYISKYNENHEPIIPDIHIEGIDPTKVNYIIEEAAYWRKANHIHNWFVHHVQDQVDDCGHYHVERASLVELRDLCLTVLEKARMGSGQLYAGYTLSSEGKVDHYREGMIVQNPEDIEELLPTKSGFFFGSTDYDEWYIEDVQYTLEALNSILESVKEDDFNVEFEYHSSW